MVSDGDQNGASLAQALRVARRRSAAIRLHVKDVAIAGP